MENVHYRGYSLDYYPNCTAHALNEIYERMMGRGDQKLGHFDDIINFCSGVEKKMLEFHLADDYDGSFSLIGICYMEPIKIKVFGNAALTDAEWACDLHIRPHDGYWYLGVSLFIDKGDPVFDAFLTSRIFDEDGSSEYTNFPKKFDYLADDYRKTTFNCFIQLGRELIAESFEQFADRLRKAF